MDSSGYNYQSPHRQPRPLPPQPQDQVQGQAPETISFSRGPQDSPSRQGNNIPIQDQSYLPQQPLQSYGIRGSNMTLDETPRNSLGTGSSQYNQGQESIMVLSQGNQAPIQQQVVVPQQPFQQPYFPQEQPQTAYYAAQNNGSYAPPQQMQQQQYRQYAPPQRMGTTLFRYKTTQKVPLTNAGNFVVEVPVPSMVLESSSNRTREFSHLRYSAVVGDPNDFLSKGYTLRQQEYSRDTELFIVVTMYNEDQDLFYKTWAALQSNIDHLCKKKNNAVWGPEGWKRVVVCIVSDGRTKINQKTLAAIGALGAYQEGLMKTSINGQDVAAHVFEYTTQVTLDKNLNVVQGNTGSFPIQVLFCLKEKNAKKINSHRWFFNAFGRVLNPNVCVLIDVGTKPSNKSLYYLWKEFDHDPMVAGACGEIYAEQGAFASKLLNPLVAAQNFEYKMSNILDKPLESMFGFIAVLPGAFSAYRYKALQNRQNDGEGPLDKYFIGEQLHGGANLVKANMYLAEDRILCFELVTKRNEAWVLRYVKRARAETDVPDQVPEFVSQRRRWLNGSFFAGLHAIMHFYQIFRSGHSFGRKMILMLEMVYNVINLLFNWFGLATFYLSFVFLTSGVIQTKETDPFNGSGEPVFITTKNLYLFSLVTIFIAALGNRPQGSKALYTISFILFAAIMGLMLYISGFTINLAVSTVINQSTVIRADGTKAISGVTLAKLVLEPAFRDLVLSLIATYGVYIIASIVYLEPWHLITSLVQYMLLLPSFINILMVYAFCNLHDVSWGTKGDNKPADGAAVVTKKEDGKQVVTVDLPTNQKDIDANYYMFLKELQPKPEVKAAAKKEIPQEDYFKSFRTRVVLFWLLSNAILVFCLTTPEIAPYLKVDLKNPRAFNPFLSFLFWSVAGLSAIRFVGSMLYILTQNRKKKGSNKYSVGRA